LPDKVLSDLILATKKVARILDNFFEDVGRCGMVFEGFGVDHMHSKLFPMHGTADMKKWKPIESRTMNKYFEEYEGYVSSHDSERADDKKLAELAEKIRKSSKS
jgi:diadenosine tetraphosphate (Ap4A) HIT family hydrolase